MTNRGDQDSAGLHLIRELLELRVHHDLGMGRNIAVDQKQTFKPAGYVLLQVHSMSKRVEYRGEFVELTDSLAMLPAGGQVLLSDSTFQRIGGRLHEVKLPTSAVPTKLSSMDDQYARQSTRASLDMPSRKSSVTAADSTTIKKEGASKKGLSVLRVEQVCSA